MKPSLPKLYVKTGCPWCDEAITWLQKHHVAYELSDVRLDAKAYETMVALSGQTKAPTLQMPDGRILADFGVEELPAFLKQ